MLLSAYYYPYVADGLDGRVARALGVAGPMGS